MYMAMPSANVVMPDKMQFQGGGSGVVGGSGDMLHPQHRQWFPDERDGFILWLRGEFAASNAIIDSLCHHLRLIGEPGEYDGVIGCIQQRRCNWNPVLHMQQYFSVAEVLYALQQVTWRRHQRFSDPVKMPFRDSRRSGGGAWSRHGHKVDSFNKETAECHSSGNSGGSEREEKTTAKEELPVPIPVADDVSKSLGDLLAIPSSNPVHEVVRAEKISTSKHKGPCDVQLKNDLPSSQTSDEKQNLSVVAKTFVANETFDNKTINVVEGMKLYEDLFNETEVSNLTRMVTDLRDAGKKGQFQGQQTYVVSKRPMKGHGREMLQLGLPIADAPVDEESAYATSRDRKVEPIPTLLQDVIERLIASGITNVKPDSCIIDIFNEGEHSHPHAWPNWFGRPVSVMFLTECDMTFGKVIGVEHPGDFRGSLKLSLTPGSVLSLQGRSSDMARYAIPSLGKQRIIVTMTKSQPRRITPTPNADRSSPNPSPHWATPSNPIRHPKHFVAIPAPTVAGGVLPRPPQNGGMHQTVFVPAPPAMPHFAAVPPPPTPVGAVQPSANGSGGGAGGWGPAAPPPPRPLGSGTGVFLPSGSANAPPPLPPPLPVTDQHPTASTDTDKTGAEGCARLKAGKLE